MDAPPRPPSSGTEQRHGPNLARPWKFPGAGPDSIRCRRHLRNSLLLPVRITLYRSDGSSYDDGTGVITDLSYSGLRLAGVYLAHGRLLATYFMAVLRSILRLPGHGHVSGRILRNFSAGVPSFGIEFLAPQSGAETAIRSMREVVAAGR